MLVAYSLRKNVTRTIRLVGMTYIAGKVTAPRFLATGWFLSHFGHDRPKAEARYERFVLDVPRAG